MFFYWCERRGTIFLLIGNYIWKTKLRMRRIRKRKQNSSIATSGWDVLARTPITIFDHGELIQVGYFICRRRPAMWSQISACLLPVLQLQLALWNLFVFMLCIFRIISNLIAISLVLPAAAAHKIKSRPRKGMLGWSFLIDQMLCCSNNSGHLVPSEPEKNYTRCADAEYQIWLFWLDTRTIFHLHISQEKVASNGDKLWICASAYLNSCKSFFLKGLFFFFVCFIH